jgi:hypothetical protein
MNTRSRHVVLVACFLLGVFGAADVCAATYQVGPSRAYTRLQDVTPRLGPGDVVEVDGNATYPSGVVLDIPGTADRRITIRGVRVGGKRPIISGTDRFGFEIDADYITVEGFEITGGITKAGIGQYGHEVRISDCLVHDFPNADAILGYGTGTGNTTIEYTEVHHTGNTVPTAGHHQIYMATDEHAHPGSVFRLQYCYIHDAIGNSNVKSRSERNEIYYNWLESPGFHDMDLYGIDPEDNESVTQDTKREDSDVVGNIVVCNPDNSCARIGGDGTGNSKGRFRFVNNTFIQTGSGDIIRTFQDVETLEMYNNVIYSTTAGRTTRVLNDDDGSWVHGSRLVIGSNNFILTGATNIPTQLTGTVTESTPGFANAAAFDFTPATGSPLINAGAMSTPTVESYPFANPLFPPRSTPPFRTVLLPDSATARPSDGAIDIGAVEAPSPGGAGGAAGGSTGAGGDTPGAGGTTSGSGGSATGGGGIVATGGATSGRGGSVAGSGGVIAGAGGVAGGTTGAGGAASTGGVAAGGGGIVGRGGSTSGRGGSAMGTGGSIPGAGGSAGVMTGSGAALGIGGSPTGGGGIVSNGGGTSVRGGSGGALTGTGGSATVMTGAGGAAGGAGGNAIDGGGMVVSSGGSGGSAADSDARGWVSVADGGIDVAGANVDSGSALPGKSSSSGCGCRVIAPTRSGPALWIVMGLGVGLVWRRGRRRPQ